MRALPLLCALLTLTACTWETYQNEQGHTGLRPKYEAGTRVYYEDGTYSHDQRYNNMRPVPHALPPQENRDGEPMPNNIHWQDTQVR
ncbi:hypothetical protein [Stenoxybacter acetivorans]|uniref:hypothetical protein n=1 Tax=Stenoxybacter acetivorans TaxID=422441 RepID=UPI00068B11F8|nr:hypothetical protein [Stenoxybacter acetivorans]